MNKNEILTRNLAKASFYIFLQEFWNEVVPNKFIDNWHIRYICDTLQGNPLNNDIIINIPPGTSKSTICSVLFPVWLWVQDPTTKILTGSHTTSLALEMSTKSRDVIRSDKFKRWFPHVRLKDDTDTKSNYKTDKLGQRYATAVGSEITGFHANWIIIDDPVPAAPTVNQLQRANKWMWEKLATRKADKENTPTVLIMQRVSEDDPTKEMIEKSTKHTHINLPATLSDSVKPDEAKLQYVNGLLDPHRLNMDVLKDIKAQIGTHSYGTQFLQDPQPTDGGIVKASWIHINRDYSSDKPIHFWIDPAYTDNINNDPTGIIGTRHQNGVLTVVWAKQYWLEFPKLVKQLLLDIDLQGHSTQSKVYIEPKASGLSLIQQLKQSTTLNVFQDEALKQLKGDKDDRLKAVSPAIESGRVHMVPASWNDTLLEQLTQLKPVHDDLRDCLVMAIQNNIYKNAKSGEYSWRSSKDVKPYRYQ